VHEKDRASPEEHAPSDFGSLFAIWEIFDRELLWRQRFVDLTPIDRCDTVHRATVARIGATKRRRDRFEDVDIYAALRRRSVALSWRDRAVDAQSCAHQFSKLRDCCRCVVDRAGRAHGVSGSLSSQMLEFRGHP